AKLIRTDTGASFVIHTNGLEGGDAVTVWWVVWNDPSNCAGPGLPGVLCGLGDLFVDGNSIFYAAGHVIGTSGRANYGGYVQAGAHVGQAVDGIQLLFGSGLTDPRGAEIHFVVRTHGPAVPGFLPAMIQSFNGGCDPGDPNEGLCTDLQAAAFPVP
ncbi:MAG: hypothetical protein LN413_05760, partial [Candidatus Thermoplasmatota archaeon]|nr:hypothetical protein [Candidatus Thermoplasmatota archaeon]